MRSRPVRARRKYAGASSSRVSVDVATRQFLDDVDDAQRSIEAVLAGFECARLPCPHQRRAKCELVGDDTRLDEAPAYFRRARTGRDLNEALRLRKALVRLLNPIDHVEDKRRSATADEDDDDKK